VLLAAVRRFLLLLVAVTAGVAVVSLLLGLALDASLSRALSLGFYAVGAFLLVSGFFMGSRGPARLRGQPGDEGVWGLGRKSGVRLATPEESADAVATTAVFLAVGIAMLVLGVLADSRYSLY
jgi:hypothetical protein